MASLDVIALDPAVPQLRAPGVGDTYHFCRVVEFQDGTVTAPALTNVGDANTGIYFPAADTLGLAAGGVEPFRVGASSVIVNNGGADIDFQVQGDTNANLVFVDASTDRIGFGTNAPDRLVDVNGTSKFRDQILISGGQPLTLGLQALQMPTGVESTIGAGLSTRTGVAGESIVQFGNNMNTYYTGSVNAAKAGAMIRLDTRGVEPTPGASAYSVFQIQTRAAGVADPNYTVPVQIGAAPQGTFCIQTNGLVTANYGFVVNEGGGNYDTRFEGDTDTHLFFADASTDFVGIGTSTPGSKLDVKGTLRLSGATSGYVGLQGAAAAGSTTYTLPSADGTNGQVLTTNGSAVLSWQTNAGGDVTGPGSSDDNAIARYDGITGKIIQNSAVFIDDAGDLGIGTNNPTEKLHIVSGTPRTLIEATTNTSAAGFAFTAKDGAGVSANGAILFEPTSSSSGRYIGFSPSNIGYQMVVNAAGNVGIGTTSPSSWVTSGVAISGGWGSGSTGLSLVSSSAASATNIARIDFVLGNTFGGQERSAAIWGLNPNASSNNGGALVFGTSANGTATTPSERARIDASGNLGLGVTPSAGSVHLDVSNGGSIYGLGTGAQLAGNAAFNGGVWAYRGTGRAARIDINNGDSGGMSFNVASSSGTAGNTITFTQAMTLDASGNLGIGTTSPFGRLHAKGTDFADVLYRLEPVNNSYASKLLISSASSGDGGIRYGSGGSNLMDIFSYGDMRFFVGTANISGTVGDERARITGGGDLLVGTTGPLNSATNGIVLAANGGLEVYKSAASVAIFNRNTDDGVIVSLAQADAVEGTISVSGNTVSYNAFAGSHWSQLQDGSKPDILRGTVMESINELCVWPGEQNERLPKSKVSDTAGSKKVYGVFMAWDNDWTATNDMYVTAVGAFICRVNGSVTVQEGDLLESNGDGTARVQADDIIRSSTIGKVTSTVKTHQYDDGSYCVPTVLYCG
jgi:hypothetical protein